MIRARWRWHAPGLSQRIQCYLWASIRFYSRRTLGRYAILMLARRTRDHACHNMHECVGMVAETVVMGRPNVLGYANAVGDVF